MSPTSLPPSDTYMNSVAKGFPTLHGDPKLSMNPFEPVDGLFSIYALNNKKTKKRTKNPGKSWSRVEIRNLL